MRNLTDGILGDCLSIQIITTFNMKREKIDQVLLRKGRLIAEHKFENLSVEESNKLFNHLGKDYITDKPMSLADIYNIDVEIYKTNNIKKGKRSKSKYSVAFIKELKNKINSGIKINELSQQYPEIRKGFFYELKNNRRWSDI